MPETRLKAELNPSFFECGIIGLSICDSLFQNRQMFGVGHQLTRLRQVRESSYRIDGEDDGAAIEGDQHDPVNKLRGQPIPEVSRIPEKVTLKGLRG